jgi:hypothetical protein
LELLELLKFLSLVVVAVEVKAAVAAVVFFPTLAHI